MQPSVVLQTWAYSTKASSRSYVLPDGCQDLILNNLDGMSEHWFVSALMDTPHIVESGPGETFQGYRFRPGAIIDEPRLLAALCNCRLKSQDDLFSLIEDFVHLDVKTTEALTILAETPTVTKAAHTLGVTERTLERLIVGQTRRTPSYWKNLARIRRTAATLNEGSLADIAVRHGYADQAHMSREFKRWFGLSPLKFKAASPLRSLITQPGYG